MKRIIEYIRRWRYRRLYRKLVFAYISNGCADRADYNAAKTFADITGYYYSDFR